MSRWGFGFTQHDHAHTLLKQQPFPYRNRADLSASPSLESSFLWLPLRSASLLPPRKACPARCRPSRLPSLNIPPLVHCKASPQSHSPGEPAALRVSTALPCGCSVTIYYPRQPRAALSPLQSSSNRTSKTRRSGEGALPSPLSRERVEEFKWPREDGQKPIRLSRAEGPLPWRLSPLDRMPQQHRRVCHFVRKRKEPFW